jgi:hypothetical protein
MNYESPMSISRYDNAPGREPAPTPIGRRVFVTFPGWTVGLKVGSERSFCSTKAPGQDYYHRLLDGELFIAQGDERVCFVCAEKRGLISFEPKLLRPSIHPHEIGVVPDAYGSDFELKYLPGDEG